MISVTGSKSYPVESELDNSSSKYDSIAKFVYVIDHKVIDCNEPIEPMLNFSKALPRVCSGKCTRGFSLLLASCNCCICRPNFDRFGNVWLGIFSIHHVKSRIN